ncbi:unnamed protein product [Tilletia controversa]|nr:unnamed protein product [Tilletia controversa]CAD6929297.1 unnamed protein product [Tilletia controversa]
MPDYPSVEERVERMLAAAASAEALKEVARRFNTAKDAAQMDISIYGTLHSMGINIGLPVQGYLKPQGYIYRTPSTLKDDNAAAWTAVITELARAQHDLAICANDFHGKATLANIDATIPGMLARWKIPVYKTIWLRHEPIADTDTAAGTGDRGGPSAGQPLFQAELDGDVEYLGAPKPDEDVEDKQLAKRKRTSLEGPRFMEVGSSAHGAV